MIRVAATLAILLAACSPSPRPQPSPPAPTAMASQRAPSPSENSSRSPSPRLAASATPFVGDEERLALLAEALTWLHGGDEPEPTSVLGARIDCPGERPTQVLSTRLSAGFADRLAAGAPVSATEAELFVRRRADCAETAAGRLLEELRAIPGTSVRQIEVLGRTVGVGVYDGTLEDGSPRPPRLVRVTMIAGCLGLVLRHTYDTLDEAPAAAIVSARDEFETLFDTLEGAGVCAP